MILQKSLYYSDLILNKHFFLLSMLKQLWCLIFVETEFSGIFEKTDFFSGFLLI